MDLRGFRNCGIWCKKNRSVNAYCNKHQYYRYYSIKKTGKIPFLVPFNLLS